MKTIFQDGWRMQHTQQSVSFRQTCKPLPPNNHYFERTLFLWPKLNTLFLCRFKAENILQ